MILCVCVRARRDLVTRSTASLLARMRGRQIAQIWVLFLICAWHILISYFKFWSLIFFSSISVAESECVCLFVFVSEMRWWPDLPHRSQLGCGGRHAFQNVSSWVEIVEIDNCVCGCARACFQSALVARSTASLLAWMRGRQIVFLF